VLPQDRAQRQFYSSLALGLHRHEYRGFAEPATQPDTDDAKHTAQQKRVAPGVIKDFRRGERLSQKCRRQGSDQVAESQPRL